MIPTRIFRIDQMDLLSIIGWRLNAGPLEPYKKNFYLEGILGTGKRDFRQLRGPTIQLRDTGSTPQARLLNGPREGILAPPVWGPSPFTTGGITESRPTGSPIP